jgi:hypothetical protein
MGDPELVEELARVGGAPPLDEGGDRVRVRPVLEPDDLHPGDPHRFSVTVAGKWLGSSRDGLAQLGGLEVVEAARSAVRGSREALDEQPPARVSLRSAHGANRSVRG